jgi:DNA-directed RNA polymerase subunit RPC12/RpoP
MPTKCPFCGYKRIAKLGPGIYRCASCMKHFDDEPDEGGDWGNQPSDRMERREREENRRWFKRSRR